MSIIILKKGGVPGIPKDSHFSIIICLLATVEFVASYRATRAVLTSDFEIGGEVRTDDSVDDDDDDNDDDDDDDDDDDARVDDLGTEIFGLAVEDILSIPLSDGFTPSFLSNE